MLGDKIYKAIKKRSFNSEALKELKELIESHEKRVELEEALEADHASSQEIIDDLTIDYNRACEEIEELKEDALLGRAFKAYYLSDRAFPYYDKSDYEMFESVLLDWYQDQTKEEG